MAADRVRGTERELAVLLRTGPFERALRAAIAARGLSLERLHVRLAERGAQVSLASLSNWQRGRSRPERSSSLVAVGELEVILGLPAHSLVTLLGPRRPRGRWLADDPTAQRKELRELVESLADHELPTVLAVLRALRSSDRK
ncbi:hypothetical protein Aple_076620 [Acrocarpospora pleiomorpha]|uniref:Uncharacterized protein n=1 Tax=Acrocarpospora pleiomorpha TaxID=90975 RepID=A0A5M3XZ85_9ACTN|nr:hypothetical protein [Acrocarpospora pleiomorpha]GES24763.1 hypothetical protein Aple_076620 [Acrocarpospora pleiomorpha]